MKVWKLQILCSLTIALLCCTQFTYGQWLGTTNSTSNTYRTGKVGIGTTSPTDKLHVVGGDNDGTNATLKIVSDATMLIDVNEIDTDSYYGLYLNNNSDKNVIIGKGGGNTGIGTSSPQEKLHIGGAVRGNEAGGSLKIKTEYGYVNIGPQSSSNFMHFITDRNKYYFNKEIRVNSGKIGSYSGDLSLCIGGYSKMKISGSGNITWGNQKGMLSTDHGSSLQLGGSGTPYIKFSNDTGGGHDMQIKLEKNNMLRIEGNDPENDTLYVNGSVHTKHGFSVNNFLMESFFNVGNHDIIGDEEVYLRLNKQMPNGANKDASNNPMYKSTIDHKSIFISPQGRLILGTIDPCVRNSQGHALNVNGSVKFNSAHSRSPNFTIPSDKRLKKDIIELPKSLDKFNEVKLYEYEYKTNIKGRRMGIMAQEIQKILPRSVGKFKGEDGKEYLNFNPSDLHFLHMKATQELSKKVEEIESVKNENNILKERVENLENQLNEIYTMLANNEGVTQIQQAPTMLQNANMVVGQNIPNPATNETIIPYFIPENSINASLTITDATGKVMTNQKIKDSDNGNLTINTASFPTGTYLYFITVDGKISSSRKMIIE